MSSTSSGPVFEGVFAISKPSAITSAQVIRDVQGHFDPSELFKPWLDRERARRDGENHNQKQKRKWRGRRAISVKMGHGGTLDPMATGVLILGLGSGTKQLHYFSDQCTKSYETVVLFGAATDTYDTEGKIVSRKPFDHITRDTVEKALAAFRGKIMQKPPIFSALRVQGKRLYEYAREGKEVPVEIQARPVEVQKLEILEWMDGGTHQWHWPGVEAEAETKYVAGKALGIESDMGGEPLGATDLKRKHSEEPITAGGPPSSKKHRSEDDTKGSKSPPDLTEGRKSSEVTNSVAEAVTDGGAPDRAKNLEAKAEKASNSEDERTPCPAPACRIRMTVTSGFYVRSLCHDLGAAIGSLGTMASLVRTQQGDFKLGTNVLQYDDLKKGEDVWGPQVKAMLQNWVSQKGEGSA